MIKRICDAEDTNVPESSCLQRCLGGVESERNGATMPKLSMHAVLISPLAFIFMSWVLSSISPPHHPATHCCHNIRGKCECGSPCLPLAVIPTHSIRTASLFPSSQHPPLTSLHLFSCGNPDCLLCVGKTSMTASISLLSGKIFARHHPRLQSRLPSRKIASIDSEKIASCLKPEGEAITTLHFAAAGLSL